MSLRSVEFTGAKLLQIIVLLQCLELLLQDRCGFHLSEDTGDAAVDFEGCGLVARGLADHHLLDELAYEVDEGLLCLGIGVFAQVIECRVDDQLDSFGADFRLQLLDLLPEIFFRRRLLQPGLDASAAFLKRVEHIVKGDETRATLSRTVADLPNNLALFLFRSFQFPGNALALVRFLLDRGCKVATRLTSAESVAQHLSSGVVSAATWVNIREAC